MQSGSAPPTHSTRPIAQLTLLAVVFVLATALMDTDAGLTLAQWPQAPGRLLLNAAPGLLLVGLLLALTRRAVLSVLLVLLVEALLYGINALKIQNLGLPLLPADVYMLGQLSHSGVKLLGGYETHFSARLAAHILGIEQAVVSPAALLIDLLPAL